MFYELIENQKQAKEQLNPLRFALAGFLILEADIAIQTSKELLMISLEPDAIRWFRYPVKA